MANNPFAVVNEQDCTPLRIFIQQCVQAYLTLKLRLGYHYTVLGKENIPPLDFGSYIVAANHTSNLDPPIVSVALRYRPIAYMAKNELFQPPLMGHLYKLTGAFAVNRDKMEISTLKSAKFVLQTGHWLLGMFPEGTRNESGEGIQELKKGVAVIAKSAKVPILPIGITRKGPKGKEIIARIGQLIPYQEDADALHQQLQQTLYDLTLGAEKEKAESF